MSQNRPVHNWFLVPVFFVFVLILSIILGQYINNSSKVTADFSGDFIFALRKFIPEKEIKVPIFVYHYVEYVKDQKDTTRKSLAITPNVFEAQMVTLKEGGYSFITFKDVERYLRGVQKLPEKPIIITFDDGYEDFYTDVFPIIKKHSIQVTQYLVVNFIGKPNYLKDEQIRTLIKSGLVEFGSHTLTHVNLKSVPAAQALYEISESKNSLEKIYQMPISTFAYPYGAYTEEISRIVEKEGYSTAVTTEDGITIKKDERFRLKRVHPGIDTGVTLLRRL